MTGSAEDAAIRVADLRKRYGAVQAVDGSSFRVARGEVFGMLGPNGAGKTTTVEIIEGLRQADSGSVTVLGFDVVRQPRSVNERIGIQLQTPSLLPRLTVAELLGPLGSFFPQAAAPDDLIRMVGLDESRDRLAGYLSGGQAQRLSIALALVNNPEIVFLDEPTTGLDPQARQSVGLHRGCTRAVPPCSSPPTTWKRPSACATAWRLSTTAALSPPTRRAG